MTWQKPGLGLGHRKPAQRAAAGTASRGRQPGSPRTSGAGVAPTGPKGLLRRRLGGPDGGSPRGRLFRRPSRAGRRPRRAWVSSSPAAGRCSSRPETLPSVPGLVAGEAHGRGWAGQHAAATARRGGRRGCSLVVELGEGRILGRPAVEPSVDAAVSKSAGPRHRATGDPRRRRAGSARSSTARPRVERGDVVSNGTRRSRRRGDAGGQVCGPARRRVAHGGHRGGCLGRNSRLAPRSSWRCVEPHFGPAPHARAVEYARAAPAKPWSLGPPEVVTIPARSTVGSSHGRGGRGRRVTRRSRGLTPAHVLGRKW